MPDREASWRLIPGRLRGALGRALAHLAPGGERLVLDDRHLAIAFRRTVLDGEVHFVPAWAAHKAVCRKILAGKRYEPLTHAFVRAFFAGRQGSMVHAGTYFGDMLPSFSRACPGHVYAFEPVLEHYVLARLCVQANRLDNVLLFHAGLGPDACPARVDTGRDVAHHRGGGARIAGEGQPATLLPLDFFRTRDVALIHLDVEGYELPALQGAVATLDAVRPTILIEDNPRLADGFLSARGYACLGSIPGVSIWEVPERAASTQALIAALPTV
jgi:FkbM family methyltransferase